MPRFEKTFQGKDNAGIRRKIRACVKSHADGKYSIGVSVGEAILGLSHSIAFTPMGFSKLQECAADYVVVRS